MFHFHILSTKGFFVQQKPSSARIIAKNIIPKQSLYNLQSSFKTVFHNWLTFQRETLHPNYPPFWLARLLIYIFFRNKSLLIFGSIGTFLLSFAVSTVCLKLFLWYCFDIHPKFLFWELAWIAKFEFCSNWRKMFKGPPLFRLAVYIQISINGLILIEQRIMVFPIWQKILFYGLLLHD